MYDLIVAARTVSLPFEMSPDGTFLRFRASEGNSVYVVRNAWRGGYTVQMMTNGARTQIGHYLEAEEAVAVAADVVAGGSARGRVPVYSHQRREMAS